MKKIFAAAILAAYALAVSPAFADGGQGPDAHHDAPRHEVPRHHHHRPKHKPHLEHHDDHPDDHHDDHHN